MTRPIALLNLEPMPTSESAAAPSAAVLLAEGLYRSVFAKTSHGLVRGPSRWPVHAVVDSTCAGADAGELLDGLRRDIPVVDSLETALARSEIPLTHAVIGVATVGGVLPSEIRRGLVAALRGGLTVVNGLHHLLTEREPELVALAERFGGRIHDIRKPPPTHGLHFWTGAVLDCEIPRVAVLGTDCAVGKRTTAGLVRAELERRGLRAAMVFTGQTGWLQGYEHGFIFDATPNDFVCGELEHFILRAAEKKPDVILIEGQSSLRNPSGPCGAELLLATGACGALLQHAPGRPFFEGLETVGCAIPDPDSEIALIKSYGVPVWGVGLHDEGLAGEDLEGIREGLEDQLGIPVSWPLADRGRRLAEAVARGLDRVLEPGGTAP
ncbi:MAG: DUF1611 domain-containing protein [Acidobacteriota bacterium]